MSRFLQRAARVQLGRHLEAAERHEATSFGGSLSSPTDTSAPDHLRQSRLVSPDVSVAQTVGQVVPCGTMRALAKLRPERGIWKTQVDVPVLAPQEVMIRIDKTAICGTDLHIYAWDQWAQATLGPIIPMVTGHEFVGTVVALGTAVPTGIGSNFLRIGARVSGEGHIVCGFCRRCRAGNPHLCRHTRGVGVNRAGCFAQYLSIPAYNVFPLPDYVSDDHAAIMDPFGNAVHTALSFDLLGEDVLITGAGPIGCMAVAVCRKAGARYVVVGDPNPWRRELALKMGADRVFDPRTESAEKMAVSLGMTEGFDVGLEMSGAGPALSSMIDSLAHGGKVALLGIPPAEASVNWQNVVFRGVEIRGIYGRKMFETWYKMTALLRTGIDLDSIITHRMPLEQFQDGFDAMESGQCGKVVLDWADVHEKFPVDFQCNGVSVPCPVPPYAPVQ
eukprot:TRINITY_DN2575_c5_g1_i3.p1 TRINITY_DN2575_c5_g1~~TRINITY_DN2575_c5_g1_i3.p1  ORF type:complete len:465 (-),score=77.51 TRINITY_DN2575_c5_g1_i3:387-1724(-)